MEDIAAHPLHYQIGSILYSDQYLIDNGYDVERDPACGGDHNISMFCQAMTRNELHFADADIIITKGGKIRVILEIEESDINAIHIMGKFLGNALSHYHIYKLNNYNISCTQDSTLFLQICDAKGIKRDSVKKKQFDNIEASIKKMLPVGQLKIVDYRILYGTQDDFAGKQGIEIKNIIRDFLIKYP